MSHIADRLAQARRSRMVGRELERALFRSALEADELPFCLLHVSGPGGVGKTALLQVFRDLCAEQGAHAVALDARNIEPSPDAFLAALRAALALPPTDDPILSLGRDTTYRRVLLVDTYETLEMLDAWVREAFLPRLPANTLVVLAGRSPLHMAWRSDVGWQPLLRTIALRNLSPGESRDYLTTRSFPESQLEAALEFTHGHPLALSLVVDVFTQRVGAGAPLLAGGVFDPEGMPDVVQELLDRLVEQAPSPAHRTTLEACATVRLLDESLLAAMLKDDGAEADAPTLFQWLCDLSFIEKASRGVFPHDVVREALLADLRWRNWQRYTDLHRRARAYYTAHIKAADGPRQQSMLYDCVFLHRDNAVIRAAFTWQEEQIYPDTLQPSDHAAVVRMVTYQEGEESAHIARHWLERQPEATLVFRSGAAGPPVGFLTMLSLHLASEEERASDPAARVAWDYLTTQHAAPLRPGEGVIYTRFWMAQDTYQAMSPVQSLIIVNALRRFLTQPRVAFTFFACGQAEEWEPVFGYVEIPRLPEAEFTVGERRYGVFGSDWREVPPAVWLARLGERETRTEPAVAPTARPQPAEPALLVLSEAEFQSAVRDALRSFTREAELRRNPLLRSPLVAGRAGAGADATARVETLRTLLRDTAQSLAAAPRLARAYRALHHTYLQPAPTQEQVAELLNLPFSTYRRHLAEGIAEVARQLWSQETGSGAV